MRQTRLNLTALRGGLIPRPPHYRNTSNDPAGLGSDLTMSRRELLGMAGVAAVGMSPVIKAIDTSLRGPFELVHTRDRASFRLGGREMWAIDTRRFAGDPVLTVSKTDGAARVCLTGARHPGTNLPADIACELRQGVVGWKMKVKLALGDFSTEVPLERWLAGVEQANGTARLKTVVCDLGPGRELSLDGKSEAQLRSDGTLSLKGRKIARLDTVGGKLFADSVAISVLAPTDPSLLAKAPQKRALLTLSRGDRAWPIESELLAPEGWSYEGDGRAFDIITVETGESRTGGVRRAMVAESASDEASLMLRSVSGIPGDCDEALGIPLRRARFAATFGASEEHRAVVARFGEEPVWLHAEGCSMQIGDSPEAPDFEVSGRDGKASNVMCAPALLAIAAPLIGAVTETAKAAPGSTVLLAAAGNTTARPRPVQPSTATKVENARPAARPPAATRPGVKVVPATPAKVIPAAPVTIRPGEKKQIPSAEVPFNLTVSVVRPSDMLVLRFEFVNLSLVTSGTTRLVRKDPKLPSFIVVHLPPQNIAERAFYEVPTADDAPPGSSSNETPPNPPIEAMMSGPSRLVFRMPDKTTEISYTLKDLMDWSKFEPSLVAGALPPPGFKPEKPLPSLGHTGTLSPSSGPLELNTTIFSASTHERVMSSTARVKSAAIDMSMVAAASAAIMGIKEPGEYQTALEVPYRLILSPHQYEGWAHSVDEVTRNGVTELWHTRLGMRKLDGTIDESASPYRTLRAVWSPDHKSKPSADSEYPFRSGITPWQRYQIVELCSQYGVNGYQPLPVQADRLMLTSMGAWLKSRGNWNPRKLNLALSEWKHVATMGRDHYVKIVELGYLYPFGHLAVRTWVTERKFQESPSKKIGAYLRKRMFITVLKPVMEYPAIGAPDMLNRFPFTRVKCVTDITPDLEHPKMSPVLSVGQDAFWPKIGADLFEFQWVGEDSDGRHSDFKAPALFVTIDKAFKSSVVHALDKAYRENGPPVGNPPKNTTPAQPTWRTTSLAGQRVAYAESKKPGDTSYETARMILAGSMISSAWTDPVLLEQMKETDQPPFCPRMESADVKIAAVQHLVDSDNLANITYHQSYVYNGFGPANKGEVFAKLTQAVGMKFGGSPEKSCGVVSPDMSIGGLSRGLGAVGGAVDSIANGTFDPSSFFDGAKILGSIPLSAILDKIEGFIPSELAGTRIPKLSNRPIYESGSALPVAIESSLDWETSSIHNMASNLFVANANGSKASLKLSAKRTTRLDGKESSHSITGELYNFSIELLPPLGGIAHLISVIFDNIKFTYESGKKADVKADIAKIKFLGPLTFINPLEEFLGGNNFSDPPFLDVNSSGIKAGFTQAIPTVGIGVFSLQNINLGASLKIPFLGDPVSLRFDFCERQNPFMLTVSMFGGGGYFAIELNPDGVQLIEGGLEFGGSFSLNLGVASGGVYLTAGVSYSRKGDTSEFGGHLRCGGSIRVLGIITVSLEFYMGLSYFDNPSRLYGVATLTVEIEILFFSTSVDLTVEREFGGGGDPLFKQLFSNGDWNEYCAAFAA